MFLKATRFSFLAVKFNYASLFFHLTFRRIIQDMKVNLQILFRIFCKYPVVSLSCGIFHMKLCLLNSDTELLTPLTATNTPCGRKYWKHTHIKHRKSVLIMIYSNALNYVPVIHKWWPFITIFSGNKLQIY